MVWSKVGSELQALKRQMKVPGKLIRIHSPFILVPLPLWPQSHRETCRQKYCCCLFPVVLSEVPSYPEIWCLGLFKAFHALIHAPLSTFSPHFFPKGLSLSDKTPSDHFIACCFPCLFFLPFSFQEYLCLSFQPGELNLLLKSKASEIIFPSNVAGSLGFHLARVYFLVL